MNLSLPKPDLFSFNECLWFLDRNYDECLHQIGLNTVTKAITINEQPVVFTLSESERDIQIEIIYGTPSAKAIEAIKDHVSEWLDLNRNLRPFYRLLKQHRVLNYMVSEFAGLRLIGISDLFETLCWCVIGQQINLSFAYKL